MLSPYKKTKKPVNRLTCHKSMKMPLLTSMKKLSLALFAASLCAVYPAVAGTEQWVGAGADQNWTTTANWGNFSGGQSAAQTYFNDVDFVDTAGSPINNFSVNN